MTCHITMDYDEKELLNYGSLSFESYRSDEIKLYKRRWYCLFLYAALCFTYSFASSSLGTVEHAVLLAFGWTKVEIALLTIWLNIMFILTSWLSSWLLDTKGIRVAFLFAAGYLVVGSAIRCITSTPPYCTWTYQIGQAFIGLANPVVNGGEASFTLTWFPPHQRTIATACAIVGVFLGIAICSVIAPYLVPLSSSYIHHVTITGNSTGNFTTVSPTGDVDFIYLLRGELSFYAKIQLGLTLLVFFAFVIYFPTRPPTPPSLSATSHRMDFRNGVRSMIQKPMFWVLLALFALTSGVNGGFGPMLDVNLVNDGIKGDQKMSAWMYLGAIISSVVFAFIVASVVDRYKKAAKPLMAVFLIIGFVMSLWFALLMQRVFVPNKAPLYVSFIVSQTMLLSILPVFYELVCDVTYPVGEGLSGGALNMASNIMTAMFLFIQLVPNISTLWMNWISTAAFGLCIPLILIFKRGKDRV